MGCNLAQATTDTVHVVDVWGDYGHFRRIYSTTTPLTYPIPPRPTIIGIFGAMLGLSRKDYGTLLAPDRVDIAIQVLKPVVTTRMTIKLANPKKSPGNMWNLIVEHQLINFEFVKWPRYRFYLRFKDASLKETFEQYVPHHKSVYNPSLGLSELLANFQWIGEHEVVQVLNDGSQDTMEINSVLPLHHPGIKVLPKPDYHYITERLPRVLSPERIITEFHNVILEANGKPLTVQARTVWKIEGLDATILFL